MRDRDDIRKKWAGIALGLAILGAPAARAQDTDDGKAALRGLRKRLEGALEHLEPARLAAPPDWAGEAETPILRLVQLADVHDSERFAKDRDAALDFVEGTLKPDLVLLSGDDIAGPISVEHHRAFKKILDERLHRPWLSVQGDNDTRGYDEVFGPTDWSVSVRGLHIVGLGLDVDSEYDGIGTWDGATYEWLRSDLTAHAGEPTLVLMHVPVVPPVSVGGPRMALFLGDHRQVAAVIAGHLHHDCEVDMPGIVHLVAPAVGPAGRHGIKEYRVFRDRIVVKTYERAEGAPYEFAQKWQRIPLAVPISEEAARAPIPAPLEPARREGFRTRLPPEWKQAKSAILDAAGWLAKRLRGE